MFYNAMRCAGVGYMDATVMYRSVLTFGPQWRFVSLPLMHNGYEQTTGESQEIMAAVKSEGGK